MLSQQFRVIFCRLALLFLVLGGTRGGHAAQLVWDASVPGPGLPVVASYTVYYTAVDLPLQTQPVGMNTSFPVDFLPAGKVYTLFVTATSAEGVESERSGTVTYTPSLGAAPAVVTAPVSKTLVLGEAFSLSVFATGDAPLTYQWFKDGVIIAGATSATYSVASSQLTHSGSYTVRISNTAGSAVSTPAVITILAPPTITSQPSSKTVNAGTTVTFTVSATGSAPLTYAWFKNGAIIAGATSATLTLQNVQSAANGLYTVVVSNGAGSATSLGATLTVVTAPAITSQPQGTTVNLGAAINLSVTASGTAPLTYQWLKGGVNISGATGPTLSIASAKANDAGNYSVRVSNAAGSVTSISVAVTVVSPPAITTQPVAQTLNAGGTISLSVTATGSLPLSYQWTKDQVNISGATSATFSKTAAQGNDAGSYQVRVSNSAGTLTSSAAAVTVNTPPSITTQPANRSVNFAATFSLTVQATGTQPMTFVWKKDGTAIPGATTATYSVASAASADAGVYVVEISNVAGTVTSAPATVTVFLPNAPTITTQPQSATITVNSPFSLTVVASGTGPFSYQWLKNGSTIAGATAATYSVASAQSTDSGSYVVRVSNAGGNTLSTAATVTVGTPPTIAVQPVSISRDAGLTAQFTVQANGSTPLSYQWTFGGVAIAGATSASLSIPQITSANAGSYQVRVSNSAGSILSQVATLTVTGAPSIVAQPQNQTVAYGGTINLAVQANGAAPLVYQWIKNGSAIAGATAATFQVTNADQTHSGSYSVQISNGAGQITSQTATVTVQPPVAPSITQQPASAQREPGTSVTFSVQATGTAPLSYQWLKNDTLIVGATGSTYQIGSVQPTDAASYKVRVSNIGGTSVSQAAVLTVGTAPLITSQPTSQTLQAGSPVTFSVTATGSTPLSYRWSKDGIVISGATATSYSMAQIATANAGSYSVEVTNFAGRVTSQSAVLTVLVAPSITTQPVSRSADVGTATTFLVEATGTGPLQYQWRRNGTPIAGATASTYQVSPITLADGGTYTVQVTGPGGQVVSQGATLTVTGAPAITASPQNQTLSVGTRLTLTVQATGASPLVYQWRKGAANIGGATSATFTIASAQTGDAGSYTVVVSNGAGSATSSAATVTVLTPPQITTQPQSVTVNQGSTAALTVTATGSAPLTYQWLKFGTAIPNAVNSTFTIPSTAPGDAGSYSVRVSNQIGSVTSTGAQISVITPPAITTQPIAQTLNAGATLTLSVAASGSQPLSYEWRKDNVPIPGATTAQYVKQSVQATDAGSYSVRVSNPAGTATSTSVAVAIVTPPVITAEPASQTVNFGAPLTLTVQVTGTAPLTFSWRKDGVTIPGVTAATYQVPSAGTSDSGIYVVTISNNAGTATSKPASVSVTLPDAPTITAQPQSATVTVGSPINISVQATGAGTLTYQWLKNGTAVAGATSSTFSIPSAQTSDAATYNVRVRNAGGTTLSSGAVITVGVPPAITQQPASISALAGTDVNFSVVVTGSAPLTYRWIRNGNTISGATTSTLSLTQIKAADAGSYQVEISNNAGTVLSSAATLTVTGTPVITSQPSSQTVPYGNAFSLSVSATGAQPLVYRWIKDGTFVPGATSATYQVASADLTHSGGYAVEISNGAGLVISQIATITVAQPLAPSITQQPLGANVEPGASVVFSVQATGSGTLSYQWLKNQNPIVGATSASHQIASVQAADAGSYSVRITNIGGTTISDAVLLKVGTAPSIVTQPSSQTVETGNPVTLSVQATGTAPLTYRWSKAGVLISGATSSAYTIPSAVVGDAGSYTVEISNIAGTITSEPAVVSVTTAPKPPVITAQPASRSVDVGGTTTFFVQASGSGTLTYEWIHDGLTIPGAKSATLQIGPVSIADSGTYLVRISNVAGAVVSDPATLVVTGAPIIVSSPQSQTISVSNALSLSVDVAGVAPFTYRWIKSGTFIANADGPVFEIASVQLSDAGSYSVEVSNGAGSVLSAAAIIQVSEAPVGNPNTNGFAPEITSHPVAQTVEVGGPASFSVEATGTAPLTYTWIHNGSIIAGASNAIYTISATTLEDAGTYSVQVRNSAGSAVSETANLSVVGAPVIRVHPQSQTVTVGSALALSVDAIGAAPLNYRWVKGGSILAGATNSNFLIPGAQLSDAGNYAVQISNSAGQIVSQTAVIAVIPSGGPVDPNQPVAPIFTRHPESVSVEVGKSATFAVEVTGTAPLSYSWSRNGISISGANSASFSIDAVQISDAGTYAVTVSNSAGTNSSAGATLTVTGAPKIIAQPRSQTVNVGSPLALFVDVTGVAPLTFRWSKKNTYLPSATNAILVIPSAQTSDAGNYSVEVANAAGSVLSDSAVISVVAGNGQSGSSRTAPTILRDPISQSVAIGGAVTLSVEAFGSFPMSYRWLHNGAYMTNETSPVLSISTAELSAAGTYSVEISNAVGIILSRAATLTLSGAPVVVRHPQSQSVIINDPVFLSVGVAGAAPLTYRWIKGGAYIPGATNASFIIQLAQPSDAGSYSVQIQNALDEVVSLPASITVVPTDPVTPQRPRIITHPVSQSVDVGADLTLSVQAFSLDLMTYRWLKNGDFIPGANASTLAISATRSSDAGNYSVEVSNGIGAVVSESAIIQIVGEPTLLSQPPSQGLFIGSPLELVVSYTGAEPLSFRWTKDGAYIGNATNRTLNVAAVQLTDAGSYAVEISNGAGQAISQPAVVRVLDSTGASSGGGLAVPTILQHPADQLVDVGRETIFTVSATSASPLTYAWIHNGAFIPGETSSILRIPNTQLSAAGGYAVQVSSTNAAIVSKSATLEVTGAPAIFFPPESGEVLAGSTLYLSVYVIGAEPLQYRWVKNGAFIPSATNSFLSVQGAKKTDAGTYWVQVSNPAGEAISRGAVITVGGEPVIITSPTSQSVLLNSPLDLTVEVTGGAPFNYQWIKNGAIIVDATNAVLSFSSIKFTDAGSYTVQVSNGAGTATSQPAQITVTGAPVIRTQPIAQIIPVGSTLSLAVEADGVAPFTYRWIKGGAFISDATNQTYTVAAAQTAHSGQYSVEVSNSVGKTNSITVQVTVTAFPVILQQPASQTVGVGSPITLNVEVGGAGPFAFLWKKGGVAIAGATTKTLVFASAQLTNAGTYMVEVRNSSGMTPSQNAIVTVTTENPPELELDIRTTLTGAAEIVLTAPAGQYLVEATAELLPATWTTIVTTNTTSATTTISIPIGSEQRKYLRVRTGN